MVEEKVAFDKMAYNREYAATRRAKKEPEQMERQKVWDKKYKKTDKGKAKADVRYQAQKIELKAMKVFNPDDYEDLVADRKFRRTN